jgi:hypothetical protein
MTIVTRGESHRTTHSEGILAIADERLALQAERADSAAEQAIAAFGKNLAELADENRELRAALVKATGESREKDRLHEGEKRADAAKINALEEVLRQALGRVKESHTVRKKTLGAIHPRALGIRHRTVCDIAEREKQSPSPGFRSLSEIQKQVDSLDRGWDAVQLEAGKVARMQFCDHYRHPMYQPTSDAVERYLGLP